MPAKSKLEDLLGKKLTKDSGLTEESADVVKTGMGLQTEEDNGEGNPLEKMDEISKKKPDQKDSKGSKSINADVLNSLFMSGDNTQGMFTPEEKEIPDEVNIPLHEEQDEEAKAKIKEDKVTPKGKYKEQFKKDFMKHPDEYEIITPKGRMTVAEAMRKGYDPLTKTFRQEHNQDNIKKKHLEALNDADRESLEKFTDPKNARVAPADAEKYGLNPNSPMIKQPKEPGVAGGMPPMMPPTGAPAMAMPSEGGPVGAMAPEPPAESQAAGGMDLSALLGGK